MDAVFVALPTCILVEDVDHPTVTVLLKSLEAGSRYIRNQLKATPCERYQKGLPRSTIPDMMHVQ